MNIAIQNPPNLPAMGRAQPLKAPSSLVDSPVNALVVHEQGRWVSDSDNWISAVNDLGVTAKQVSQYFQHLMRLWIKGISFGPPASTEQSQSAWKHSAFYGGLDLNEQDNKKKTCDASTQTEQDQTGPLSEASSNVEGATLHHALTSADDLWSQKRGVIGDEMCPVCRITFDANEEDEAEPSEMAETANKATQTARGFLKTNCNHLFHKDCLIRALEADLSCPLCKNPQELKDKYAEFKGAVAEGNLGLVQEILASGPISDEVRGEVVRVAAFKGYLGIVQELFKSGPILAEDTEMAVELAAREGHLEILRLIMFLGNQAHSESELNNTFIASTPENALALIEMIINNFMSGVSENQLNYLERVINQAFIAAASANQLEILKFLLDYQSAFEAAAQGNSDISLQCLFDDKVAILPHSLHQAFEKAAEGNHIGILEFLLDRADVNISAQDLNTAFIAAAAGNHIGILEFLLDRAGANILVQSIPTAFLNAVLQNEMGVIEFILGREDLNFSAGSLEGLLDAAVADQNVGLVRVFLSSGSISMTTLLRIYRETRSSHPDCANLILRQLLSQLRNNRAFQALSIASLAVMLGGGYWMMQEEEEPEPPWYWPFG